MGNEIMWMLFDFANCKLTTMQLIALAEQKAKLYGNPKGKPK